MIRFLATLRPDAKHLFKFNNLCRFGTKYGLLMAMTEPVPSRTRWDRILLGVVLALQMVTLGLLVWVIRDRRASSQVTIRQVQSTSPAAVGQIAPMSHAHMLQGDLFDDMDRAMQAMSQFPDMPSFIQWDGQWDGLRTTPAMDIRELGDRCVVSVSMPGVNPGDVDVSLEGSLLSVSASSRVKQGGNERFETFERKVHVPPQVGNPDLVRAVLSNGVLQVVLPYGDPSSKTLATTGSRRLL